MKEKEEEKMAYTFMFYGSPPARFESTTNLLKQYTDHIERWQKTGTWEPLLLEDPDDGHIATFDARAIQGVIRGVIPSPQELRNFLHNRGA